MNEFNNIYLVSRDNAEMRSKGDSRIKFRAPSFANAKVRRYKIPVEPKSNQVEVEKEDNTKYFELSTKKKELIFNPRKTRARALKLKEAREKKLVALPVIIDNSDEKLAIPSVGQVKEEEKNVMPVEQEVAINQPVSSEQPVNQQENIVRPETAMPEALGNTQFDLGGVLETIKHTDVNTYSQEAEVSSQNTVAPVDVTPEEPKIAPTVAEVNTSNDATVTSPVAEEEVNSEIDFSSEDTERIYDGLVKVRDEATDAMKKASSLAAEMEETKKEFNEKLVESDQKVQEAGAEMENKKIQAEASQTRYKKKIIDFRKAVEEQERFLKARRDKALQESVALERELKEFRQTSEERLKQNKEMIDNYNEQSNQYESTIDEYDGKTARLDAILQAFEPIEAVSPYVPTVSNPLEMNGDMQMNESVEKAPVKKVA